MSISAGSARSCPTRPARLVDKNPLNMLCLPMIMRLFPHARIILCLRHPCDVLLSCCMQPFRSPAFMVLCSSLQRLADGYVHAFEQWHRRSRCSLRKCWSGVYESVVDRFDASVARLGEFLEVEDASPMARFSDHARDKRFISTPSYAQVTQGFTARRSIVGSTAYPRKVGAGTADTAPGDPSPRLCRLTPAGDR